MVDGVERGAGEVEGNGSNGNGDAANESPVGVTGDFGRTGVRGVSEPFEEGDVTVTEETLDVGEGTSRRRADFDRERECERDLDRDAPRVHFDEDEAVACAFACS